MKTEKQIKEELNRIDDIINNKNTKVAMLTEAGRFKFIRDIAYREALQWVLSEYCYELPSSNNINAVWCVKV